MSKKSVFAYLGTLLAFLVLDGLWLEGCLAGELFGDSELVEIALTSIETLLGLRLRPIDAPRADG